jgi:hypothetical protein
VFGLEDSACNRRSGCADGTALLEDGTILSESAECLRRVKEREGSLMKFAIMGYSAASLMTTSRTSSEEAKAVKPDRERAHVRE